MIFATVWVHIVFLPSLTRLSQLEGLSDAREQYLSQLSAGLCYVLLSFDEGIPTCTQETAQT
jgi:hypothetical protein